MVSKDLIIDDGDSKMRLFVNDNMKISISISSESNYEQIIELDFSDTKELIKELNLLSKSIQ